MASRDHFRLDVLTLQAAKLQQVDAELSEAERLLKLEQAGAAGSCPSCGALYARGAAFCWQCGAGLMGDGDASHRLFGRTLRHRPGFRCTASAPAGTRPAGSAPPGASARGPDWRLNRRRAESSRRPPPSPPGWPGPRASSPTAAGPALSVRVLSASGCSSGWRSAPVPPGAWPAGRARSSASPPRSSGATAPGTAPRAGAAEAVWRPPGGARRPGGERRGPRRSGRAPGAGSGGAAAAAGAQLPHRPLPRVPRPPHGADRLPNQHHETESPPDHKPPPQKQTFSGVVVHVNPAAGSYTVAGERRAGRMAAPSTPRRLPQPGAIVKADVRPLFNGTYAEEGPRTQERAGRQRQDHRNRHRPRSPDRLLHRLETRHIGSSSGLHMGRDAAAMPTTPALGSYVEVGVARSRRTDEQQRRSRRGSSGDAQACTPDADPGSPEAIEPLARLWQSSLEVKDHFDYSDFEGIVMACPETGKLVLSADDIREAGSDLTFTAAPGIDLSKLNLGQSVRRRGHDRRRWFAVALRRGQRRRGDGGRRLLDRPGRPGRLTPVSRRRMRP